MENWKSIRGFEGYYEVSDHGRIRRPSMSLGRYKTEKVLSPVRCKGNIGYLMVTLKAGCDKAKTLYIHSTVLDAFVCSRPKGMFACHNDGDIENNHASNLRWDTRSSNEMDKVKHETDNRGQNHGMSKLTNDQAKEIKTMLLDGVASAEVASKFCVSRRHILDIARGRRWGWLSIDFKGAA